MNSGFYINYTLQEIYHIEVRWLNQPKSWPIFLIYFLLLQIYHNNFLKLLYKMKKNQDQCIQPR
ncbi:hypothetical protein pb186bvf_006248 [Paramecium bursaria]